MAHLNLFNVFLAKFNHVVVIAINKVEILNAILVEIVRNTTKRKQRQHTIER